MADLSGGIDKLPPRERLKRVREMEAEKRKLLEEEVLKKKKELEQLEKETKEDIQEAEALEEETLKEITRESAEEELEERLKHFRKSQNFVPEGGVEAAEPAGFGQVAEPGVMYQSEALQRAQENIDYLLHGTPSSERRQEVERELYSNIRDAADTFQPEESYAFNKIQDEMHELKMRGSAQRQDQIEHAYMQRIDNVLNSIIDYKQQDEEKRKRG